MKLIFAGMLVCLYSLGFACNVGDPRCKLSNELIDVLKYKEALAELQMGCRGKAVSMNPESLKANSPGVLMGIVENTNEWTQLGRAYEMFVDEACGGDEVMYLFMASYRQSWDKRLPGAKLNEALSIAKVSGKAGLADDASAVTAEVSRVIGPLIDQMTRFAEFNYSARIKGVVAGEALMLVDSGVCPVH